LQTADHDELAVFDMEIGFATHPEIRGIDAGLIREGGPFFQLTEVVGFVIVQIGTRSMGRNVIGNIVADAVDEVWTIAGIGNDLSGDVIGLPGFDFAEGELLG